MWEPAIRSAHGAIYGDDRGTLEEISEHLRLVFGSNAWISPIRTCPEGDYKISVKIYITQKGKKP